jgi:hypothetical protein
LVRAQSNKGQLGGAYDRIVIVSPQLYGYLSTEIYPRLFISTMMRITFDTAKAEDIFESTIPTLFLSPNDTFVAVAAGVFQSAAITSQGDLVTFGCSPEMLAEEVEGFESEYSLLLRNNCRKGQGGHKISKGLSSLLFINSSMSLHYGWKSSVSVS